MRNGNNRWGVGAISQALGVYSSFSLIIQSSTQFLQWIQTIPSSLLATIVPWTGTIAFVFAWISLGLLGWAFVREHNINKHLGIAIINIIILILWFAGFIH